MMRDSTPVIKTITDGLQNQLEERTARVLGPAFRDARRLIADELEAAQLRGDSLVDLPLDAWDSIASELENVIRPQLERAYIEAAQELSDGIGYGVDDMLLQTAAQQWAATYSFDLVTGMNATSKERLASVLSDFFAAPMTNRELSERLAAIYGPRRANTIAITEVTRAAAEGQAWVARQLGQAGARMIAIWETRLDEFVCPVCGPRHGTAQGTGWFMLPPAHPNCRCGVRYEPI